MLDSSPSAQNDTSCHPERSEGSKLETYLYIRSISANNQK